MDLEAWRAEIAAWIDDNAPRALYHTTSTPFQGHWGGKDVPFENVHYERWFEVCRARGLTAPRWPREFGGAELDAGRARVFNEELRARGLPLPLVGFGLAMIGPILLIEGSPEQKAQHLPPIVDGQTRWCQGYSEPGAGSDLASLRTSAVLTPDGEHFIVNGQKIWTSQADKADWIFCLVRTNPDVVKQAGITFLLIDMATPGITTRPIQLISGSSPFCEVFLEDVKVPVANVVGRIDDGWRVAKALLQFERGAVGESIAAGGARTPALLNYVPREHALAAVGRDAGGRLDDPALRDDLARFEMEERALILTLERAKDQARAGGQPGAESSLAKLVGTELNQYRWELANRIGDLDALVWEGDDADAVGRALPRQFLRSRGNTIEGGTSEVQRNIIAQRVLGLPRGGGR